MSVAEIPGVEPDNLTRPFWEACTRSQLLVQQCQACNHFQYPPMEYCGICQSHTLAWRESGGVGHVNAATTVYRPQNEAFKAPYVVAIVTLDEGWHIATNIVGDGALNAKPEDRVEVTFTTVRPGYVLPHFRLTGAAGGAAKRKPS